MKARLPPSQGGGCPRWRRETLPQNSATFSTRTEVLPLPQIYTAGVSRPGWPTPLLNRWQSQTAPFGPETGVVDDRRNLVNCPRGTGDLPPAYATVEASHCGGASA